MLTSSSDLPQKSLQIKRDDKFFSRLLSKESSMANPSFRVYYGGSSGAVPFMWESRPGTPKYTFCDTSLPPLTPPPSYDFNSKKKPVKKHSRSNLLHTIFPRKTHVSPQPLSSSSLSSSSWSSSHSSSSSTLMMSTPASSFHMHSRSSFDSRTDYGDQEPTNSALCFGVDRDTTGGFRGCYSMATMKRALLSIVGHGSGQGTTA